MYNLDNSISIYCNMIILFSMISDISRNICISDKYQNKQSNKSQQYNNPDSKVHVDHMGPTWVLSAPDGPHVGPMNLAIREVLSGSHVQELCNV